MTPSRRYLAISFDVGHTLIDARRSPPQIVADLLAELGHHTTPELLQAAYQRAERLFLEDYLRPLCDTWEADERIQRFYCDYYLRILRELELPQAQERHALTIIARYLEPTNWQPYPGVIDTLAELRARGYRLGAASDWGTNLRRILQHLGLTRYLDWVIISGALGVAKPSPGFYRLVVQRAGVPAARIVHVGDSYYADVRGARTVGMDAVLIDWRRRDLPRLDVPVIQRLSDLLDMLDA